MTYIVMDLVEGETLSALLERSGRVPQSRALDIADAVASALEPAHARGLIHRDIKPSNILIEHGGRVLLADFGQAKEVGAGEIPPSKPSASPSASGVALTHAGAIVGTPLYLAPEQALGGAIDHRADIYALGVTLYEVLTGEPPFASESQSALLLRRAVVVVAWAFGFLLALGRGKRTLLDHIVRTREVFAFEVPAK